MGTPNVSQQTIEPRWFDPLGPNKAGNHAPTRGPEFRDQIFDGLKIDRKKINQAQNLIIGHVLDRDVHRTPDNPLSTWFPSAELAKKTLNGDLLSGGPQLDSAVAKMRQASTRDAESAAANERSSAARSGVAYSTASQEGEESVRAASRASADQAEMNARQGVYTDERGKQIAAPAMLREAHAAPIDFLAQVSNAITGDWGKQAQIIQGLAGGGSYITPETNTWQKPRALDDITQVISSL